MLKGCNHFCSPIYSCAYLLYLFIFIFMNILIICDKLDKQKYHDLRFFATLFTSNPPPRLHRKFGILGEPSPYPRRVLCTENEYPRAEAKRKRSLISQASLGGGDSWTRTNDPIDVNDVL